MDCSNRSKTSMQIIASYCSDDLMIAPDKSQDPCMSHIQRFATWLFPVFLANVRLSITRHTQLQFVAGTCLNDVAKNPSKDRLDPRKQQYPP